MPSPRPTRLRDKGRKGVVAGAEKEAARKKKQRNSRAITNLNNKEP